MHYHLTFMSLKNMFPFYSQFIHRFPKKKRLVSLTYFILQINTVSAL